MAEHGVFSWLIKISRHCCSTTQPHNHRHQPKTSTTNKYIRVGRKIQQLSNHPHHGGLPPYRRFVKLYQRVVKAGGSWRSLGTHALGISEIQGCSLSSFVCFFLFCFCFFGGSFGFGQSNCQIFSWILKRDWPKITVSSTNSYNSDGKRRKFSLILPCVDWCILARKVLTHAQNGHFMQSVTQFCNFEACEKKTNLLEFFIGQTFPHNWITARLYNFSLGDNFSHKMSIKCTKTQDNFLNVAG